MANVIFMDGFDAYDFSKNNTAAPNIASKWIIAAGDQLRGAGGRYGGQCVHLGETIFGTNIRTYFNENPFYQSGTIAFAALTSSIAGMEGNNSFFNLMHNNSVQFGIGMSNIGTVRLYRGGTIVAESIPNLVRTNDWHFIEMEYVGHASVGRATLYLDGVKVIDFAGNTQAQAPYGFNGLQLSAGNGSGVFIDDLFITDQPVRVGERRIETLRPNGDVSKDFTPSDGGTSNFAMLNEPLVSADQSVSATTVGAKDLYNFTNLTTNPASIDAVQLSVWATKTDSETRQMQTIVKSGTFETTSKSYNLPTNHLDMNRIEVKDPATNAPWTTASVNAIQAGFKITR